RGNSRDHTFVKNQAAVFAKLQNDVFRSSVEQAAQRVAGIVLLGQRTRFRSIRKKNIHLIGDVQNFSRDRFTRLWADIERKKSAAIAKIFVQIPCGGFEDRSQKIVADQMQRRGTMKQDMWTRRFADEHVGAATAKKSTLTGRSHLDVNEAGHRRSCGLNPLHLEAMVAKRAAKEISKRVFADTANQPRLKAPARKREGEVGCNTAQMHFEVGCKTIVAGLRPAF